MDFKQILEKLNDKEKISPAFQKLVDKIADATDRNQHTISVILLAQYLKETDIVDELKAIDKEHNKVGYLTKDLSNKRNKLSDEIFTKAKKELSPSEYKLINSAF